MVVHTTLTTSLSRGQKMNYMADGGGSVSEQEAVERILQMLGEAETQVHGGQKLQSVPAGSFGGAASALDLSANTGKAHAHVVAAMTEMVAALQTYDANVRHFRSDVHETDADIATVLTRTQQSVDCSGTSTSDTFYNTNACTLTGDDS